MSCVGVFALKLNPGLVFSNFKIFFLQSKFSFLKLTVDILIGKCGLIYSHGGDLFVIEIQKDVFCI